MKKLSKVYDPQSIEQRIYQLWEQGGYFRATVDQRTPYTIVIPPPNVTGMLHMGHALNNTLQDILIRFKRMQGFNTLWLPGTDHAGIATQSVVEKNLLAATGQNRHDLGREKLVAHIWEWKEKYGNRILEQLKGIGASCDWERTRFTLDQVCAQAVRHTFVALYQKGLIYRGKRLVNWDPVTQTALADDEVEHKTVQGHFYYLKYPLADGSGAVVVATTRPETMLGDTAVAVNPKDERARDLIGRKVRLPLMDREIPIIADDYVKRGEGTGFLKVTPAHDPNDYEIGQRHQLPMINIFTPDANINANGGKYAGLDRYAARQAVLEDLQAQGLLVKTEPLSHQVGHSYRSHAPIEPYLSDQWFVKVGPLAQPAIEAVKSGQIKIHPARYAKTYLDWLEGIRDWCISRQLWWGHRIPIWYCQQCGHHNTGIEDPTHCEKCQSDQLKQDEDVLDTWFSSALWPHSTLGWPTPNPDLDYYYPTNVLVTSRDIITLWVSRMVMLGLFNMQQVPFRDVFIHGKILDGKGETMSKSKGNGIDPLEIIASYGADAMRFSLAQMTTESQDMRMPVKKDAQGRNISEKFDIGRNFCNKLWNASRFAMMHLNDLDPDQFNAGQMHITDRWILSRLANTIKHATSLLDEYKFNEPLSEIYRFFWNDFCDWYLESIKPRLQKPTDKPIAQNVLAFTLDMTLRLLHPFIPFITEDIFQRLNQIAPLRKLKNRVKGQPAEVLITAAWPQDMERLINPTIEEQMALLQGVIRTVREIRSQYEIPLVKKLTVSVKGPANQMSILEAHSDLICHLAGLATFSCGPELTKPANSATGIVEELEVYVHEVIDPQAERQRLEKKIQQLEKGIKPLQEKLKNENFVTRAKPTVVQQTREKLADLLTQRETVQQHLKVLEN